MCRFLFRYPFVQTHGLPGEDDIGGSLLDDEARVGSDEEPSKIGRHFAAAITNHPPILSRVSMRRPI
jgi:hypothetical protein